MAFLIDVFSRLKAGDAAVVQREKELKAKEGLISATALSALNGDFTQGDRLRLSQEKQMQERVENRVEKQKNCPTQKSDHASDYRSALKTTFFSSLECSTIEVDPDDLFDSALSFVYRNWEGTMPLSYERIEILVAEGEDELPDVRIKSNRSLERVARFFKIHFGLKMEMVVSKQVSQSYLTPLLLTDRRKIFRLLLRNVRMTPLEQEMLLSWALQILDKEHKAIKQQKKEQPRLSEEGELFLMQLVNSHRFRLSGKEEEVLFKCFTGSCKRIFVKVFSPQEGELAPNIEIKTEDPQWYLFFFKEHLKLTVEIREVPSFKNRVRESSKSFFLLLPTLAAKRTFLCFLLDYCNRYLDNLGMALILAESLLLCKEQITAENVRGEKEPCETKWTLLLNGETLNGRYGASWSQRRG